MLPIKPDSRTNYSFFFFFFGSTHNIYKYPGQGLNFWHSSNNNASSLTCWAARGFQDLTLLDWKISSHTSTAVKRCTLKWADSTLIHTCQVELSTGSSGMDSLHFQFCFHQLLRGLDHSKVPPWEYIKNIPEGPQVLSAATSLVAMNATTSGLAGNLTSQRSNVAST